MANSPEDKPAASSVPQSRDPQKWAWAAAAFAGLSLAACNQPEAAQKSQPSTAPAVPAGTAASEPATGKECCVGKNSCKGKGGCATDKHGCAGKNDCKGQGGCNMNCPK